MKASTRTTRPEPMEDRVRRLESENRALRAACQTLARNRELERDLFELAPFGYAIVDVDGCILAGNRMLAELAGERPEALPGVSLSRLVEDADAARLAQHLAEVASSGLHTQCALRLRRPEGPPIAVWMASLLTAGSVTEPPRIWCGLSARPAEPPTARAPRLDGQLLEDLAYEIDQGLFFRDANGSVSNVNARCATIWGQRPEVLAGQGLSAAVWDADPVPPAPGGGGVRRYRVARPDGTLRVVRERSVPVRDEGGRSVGVIAFVHDVTADREREELTLHQRRMETLGMFASGIAHDFANVVMGIRGCTVAAGACRSADELAQLLADIDQAADHGGRLLRRLLVFSRKQQVERSALAADASIGQAVDLVRRLMGPSVPIELHVGAPGAVVVSDQVELDQIVMNLATNARDAMPPGGVVRVRTERVTLDRAQGRAVGAAQGSFVRLVVTDTGVGMDPSTQQRVFERYFTTKPPGQGTGLGLCTVRAIAAELEGAVTVESEPGAGTSVAVLLPTLDV